MIAVVAHDAGGAEILSSYVRRGGADFCFSLDGPAVRIFERKLGPTESLPLETAVTRSDWVLAGTGWQSDLEWQAIRLAAAQGKRCVAFLDHWCNFPRRFVRNNETSLPSEIWVGDEFAAAIARDDFPGLPLRIEPNPYFEDLRSELSQVHVPARKGRARILYLCEPIAAHDTQWELGDSGHGYTEADALRFFLTHLNLLNCGEAEITIRPHPAENPSKYFWAMSEFPEYRITMSSGASLIAEIAASEIVVGCETTAMAVGLIAGKRVISCVPPGGRACGLPHRDIEHMNRMTGLPRIL